MPKRPSSAVDGNGPSEKNSHTSSSSFDPRKRSRLRQPLPKEDVAWRRRLLKEKEEVVRVAKQRKKYARIRDRALARHAAASTGGRGDLVVANTHETKKNSSDDESSGEDSEPSGDEPVEAIHPDRQAMLDEADEKEIENAEKADKEERDNNTSKPRSNWHGEQDKIRAKLNKQHREMVAETKKQEKIEAKEAREAEFARRAAEREAKRAERERMQKRMAKARRVNRGPPIRDNSRNNSRGSRDSHDGRGRRLGRESGVLLDKVKKMMGK